MNITLALTAAMYDAVLANHTEALQLLRKKRDNRKEGESEDVLCGATVRDVLTGETFDVKAKVRSICKSSSLLCFMDGVHI
jgi:hypothetical protein